MERKKLRTVSSLLPQRCDVVSIFDTQKKQTTRRTFSILPQTTAPHHWKIFDDRDQPIGEVSRRRNGNLPVIKSASAG